MSNADWADRGNKVFIGTYNRFPAAMVRGRGCRLWDADGREYTDLLAGIAVNSLGHAHPALVAAVSTQLGTLGHVSNLFTSAPQIRLAEALLDRAGVPEGSTVFFSNSGAEANEAAFKLARRHGAEDPSGGRTRVPAPEPEVEQESEYEDPYADLYSDEDEDDVPGR